MPFLCRGVPFSTKLSYHRNVSLAVYSPIFYVSFCQKTYIKYWCQTLVIIYNTKQLFCHSPQCCHCLFEVQREGVYRGLSVKSLPVKGSQLWWTSSWQLQPTLECNFWTGRLWRCQPDAGTWPTAHWRSSWPVTNFDESYVNKHKRRSNTTDLENLNILQWNSKS